MAEDFSAWDDMTEKDFKDNIEAYRSLALTELREMERNLTREMKDQIKELRDDFKGLPSERGKALSRSNEPLISHQQAWADAMFIVLFLY